MNRGHQGIRCCDTLKNRSRWLRVGVTLDSHRLSLAEYCIGSFVSPGVGVGGEFAAAN